MAGERRCQAARVGVFQHSCIGAGVAADVSQITEKMRAALANIEFLLTKPPETVAALYENAADRYDDFRGLWIALAGESAAQAMLDDLRATIRPGQRILDAGSGSGAIARQIKAIERDVELTMLDAAPPMMTRALDVPGTHVVGDVLDLPFLDDYFDIVVSAWVIETVSDPIKAVGEYLRVIKSDGRVFYTFCSLPEGWLSRAGTGWLRSVVKSRFAGEFLTPERRPWHECGRSHRASFRGGLVCEVGLAKCCTVTQEITPPRRDCPTQGAPA